MKKSATIKKILSLMLALLMVASVMLSTACTKPDEGTEESSSSTPQAEQLNPEQSEFISGIGGVSETFKGAVSEESFDTAEEAAEAYVAVEVTGSAEAVVLDSTSKGELSNDKIDSIGIPDELKSGITAVEEFEISYSIEDGDTQISANGVCNLTDTLNKTYKVTVYVIKYENDWKYFSPAPVTGNTITKSYYDSVFNAERYKNCTLSSSMYVKADVATVVNGQSTTMSTEIKTTQLIKHADNKVYLEQIIESDIYGKTSKEAIYAYMEEVDGNIVCYAKIGIDSTEWYETNLSTIGFTSLEQLAPFYDQYLDYTYFTKTGYGFALEAENAKQYITEALAQASEMFSSDAMEVDMFAEYYVSEGVLSGMRMDADISMEMDVEGYKMSLTEVATTTTTCTDYGTTVIEKPFTE